MPNEKRRYWMDESYKTIKVTVDKWIKAKMEGNYTCPECGSILLIVSFVGGAYAFCSKCKEYFVEATTCQKCGMDYAPLQLHMCESLKDAR